MKTLGAPPSLPVTPSRGFPFPPCHPLPGLLVPLSHLRTPAGSRSTALPQAGCGARCFPEIQELQKHREQKWSGKTRERGHQQGDSHPPAAGEREKGPELGGTGLGAGRASLELFPGEWGWFPSLTAFPTGFAGRSQLLLDGSGGKTGLSRLEEYPGA